MPKQTTVYPLLWIERLCMSTKELPRLNRKDKMPQFCRFSNPAECLDKLRSMAGVLFVIRWRCQPGIDIDILRLNHHEDWRQPLIPKASLKRPYLLWLNLGDLLKIDSEAILQEENAIQLHTIKSAAHC